MHFQAQLQGNQTQENTIHQANLICNLLQIKTRELMSFIEAIIKAEDLHYSYNKMDEPSLNLDML